MRSNRLSFALNLKGPSFTNFIDIHGGMESLAMGYKHVSEGFADSAIVGVSSCFKDPRISLHFIGPGLLSPDGSTRAFDDEANGYGRSDAVVCFYVQRAHEAKRSYGELKFCDVHYHGSDLPTLIGCDEKYLEVSLAEIYRRNGYLGNLSDVAYVEMNAYGLKKMDKIETNAVAKFFNRDQDHPLMIGSIKSNVGHTEGAAGLMAVLKAILTLDSGTIAPNLHLSKINSGIRSLEGNKLKVVQKLTKLNGHIVAINSLGLFGSVGHAVIKTNPRLLQSKANNAEDKLPRLLLVSGRVENDLKSVIKQIETVLYSPAFVALVNDSLGQYLPHHLYRDYTILPKTLKTIDDVQARGAENRPVWFIFSGMGSQWHGMGRELLDLPYIFALFFSVTFEYIYIMDADTDMHVLKKSIEYQMQLNLPVLVLKQDEWGSYRNLGSDDDGLHTRVASSLVNFDFGFEDSGYVSILNGPVNISDQSSVVGFAYAGSTSSSAKITGLGKSRISGLAECDPYLQWRVPGEWSSEDALTMPYIYAQAYKLFYPPMYRSQEVKSALINMGKEYMLTEAFVTLALHKRLKNLFITVTNDDEVDLIRRKFPELEASQILRHENQSYEIRINQQTQGEGVDLVVNCLPGTDHVAASLSCVSAYGYYFEAERRNCTSTNKLGLYAFLKSISFFVMQNYVSGSLELPNEVKVKLKNAIQEFIDEGVIVPSKIRQHKTKTHFRSTVHENVKIVKCASTKKALHSTPPTAVKYDDKHSYIIIGEKANTCLELLKWLVARGARKFIVCLRTLSLESEISGRVTHLREQTKATIVLTSLSKLDKIESAKQLYEETGKIAPVEAIFFVSVQRVSEKFSNLDAAVASSVHFIGISSGRLNDYEQRRSRGCPATLIHGDKLANLSNLLPYLDNLSVLDGKNDTALVLYKVTNKDPSTKNNERRKFTLREYLPTNLESLCRVARDLSEDTAFVEVNSLSRKYRDCKGVYPIFVLPALHTDLLQPLYQRLHYPVFAALNVNIASVSCTARKLFDLLNAIQPSGPVTLISEMWNLPLALELLNLVQNAGRTFKIFAIEGNPRDWKERFTYLGSAKSKQFDQRLVEDIFHFNSNKSLGMSPGDVNCDGEKVCVNNGHGYLLVHEKFEEYNCVTSPMTNPSRTRFEQVSRKFLKDIPAVEGTVDAAKVIRNKISDIFRLQFDNTVLHNITFFERKQPDESLRLSITSDVIVLEEAIYQALLKHPKTCGTINENAAFDWWEFPETNE